MSQPAPQHDHSEESLRVMLVRIDVQTQLTAERVESMDEKIDAINSRSMNQVTREELHQKLKGYASNVEFQIVKKIVYGCVAVVLSSVLLALLALILSTGKIL